jgi:parvulin-like peptidyl-prolyl isomerase
MIKRNSYKTATMASVMALTIWLVGCEKTPEAQQTGVVAKVGSFEISDKHFTNHLKRFYLRTGQAANINEDFRLAVINSRIERYSIVEYARRIWVGRNDLREVFRRFNTTLRASHLYASNRKEADSLYTLLQNGARFDDLAKSVFKNSRLASTGGDLGYFTLDEMDIAFEEQAYNMNLGEISQPVKTSQGYSIIKLTDVISTPIVTEYQFAQRRNAIMPVARDQKYELAVRNDISRVTSEAIWNDAIIVDLWRITQENFSDYTRFTPELVEIPLPVNESMRGIVIARIGGFSFTVNDFLVEAYFTPTERRLTATTLYAFEEQVKGFVYRKYALGLIRNFRGLDQEFVDGSIEETFFGYLFDRFERDIDTRVSVSDEQVRRMYNSDPEMFSKPLMLSMAEIVVSDEEAAKNVHQALMNGADFLATLKRYGLDTESKANNGELGLLPVSEFGMMAPVLGNIRAGEIAGPFQIAEGYHIVLKCLERTEPRAQTFEEAASDVRQFLFFTERRNLRDALISDLRTRYNATIDMQRLNSLSFEL